MQNNIAMQTDQQVREMLLGAGFGSSSVEHARLTLKEDGWHVELPVLVRSTGNLYDDSTPLTEILRRDYSHVGVYEIGPLGSPCNYGGGEREARRVR